MHFIATIGGDGTLIGAERFLTFMIYPAILCSHHDNDLYGSGFYFGFWYRY
jgi:hypothetical protein